MLELPVWLLPEPAPALVPAPEFGLVVPELVLVPDPEPLVVPAPEFVLVPDPVLLPVPDPERVADEPLLADPFSIVPVTSTL